MLDLEFLDLNKMIKLMSEEHSDSMVQTRLDRYFDSNVGVPDSSVCI